jgi:hypothetical protein
VEGRGRAADGRSTGERLEDERNRGRDISAGHLDLEEGRAAAAHVINGNRGPVSGRFLTPV